MSDAQARREAIKHVASEAAAAVGMLALLALIPVLCAIGAELLKDLPL